MCEWVSVCVWVREVLAVAVISKLPYPTLAYRLRVKLRQ